jgi:hypothetical protein
MIDIEAVTNRHLTKDKMEGQTFYEGHIVIDLYNAIEEIKRLRQINDSFNDDYSLLREKTNDAIAERAAVVAWLNEHDKEPAYRAAYAIECGEHLKES